MPEPAPGQAATPQPEFAVTGQCSAEDAASIAYGAGYNAGIASGLDQATAELARLREEAASLREQLRIIDADRKVLAGERDMARGQAKSLRAQHSRCRDLASADEVALALFTANEELAAEVVKLRAPCPGCESLRVQCSELAGELGACKAGNAEYRERLARAEATARLCEAELQEVHDVLVRAYGRDDLSEETAAVVTGMAAEWGRFRAGLEEIRARGQDGYVIARVLWDVAVRALSGGSAVAAVPGAVADGSRLATVVIEEDKPDTWTREDLIAYADEAAETLAGVDLMAASGDLEDPGVLRDLLLVAGEDIPLERIAGWSPEDRAKAAEWAAREHLHASDNPVERIPPPSVLHVPDDGEVPDAEEIAEFTRAAEELGHPEGGGHD